MPGHAWYALYPGLSCRTVKVVDPDQRWFRALGHLQGAARKAQRSSVPFPPAFVLAPTGADDPPPLARLIQGGRGGAVRLRLYLCITMMATRYPYDLRRPPSPNGWAQMLSLDARTGPRRISSNLVWLADNRLIHLEGRWGRPAEITLLSASGDGQEYTQPRDQGRYIGMPVAFWTMGWVNFLSPTATALLLALLDALGGHQEPKWIAAERKRQYGLSADTWTRGRKELEGHDLLTVQREPQGTFYEYTRLRNTHVLSVERLEQAPW